MNLERKFFQREPGGVLWINQIPPYLVYIWAGDCAYSQPEIDGLKLSEYKSFELIVFKYDSNNKRKILYNDDMIELGIDLREYNYTDNRTDTHGAYVPKEIIEKICSVLEEKQEDILINWHRTHYFV
jgi:hypothetical protein